MKRILVTVVLAYVEAGVILALLWACAPPKPPTPPPTMWAVDVLAFADPNYTHPILGADVQLHFPDGYHHQLTNGDGYTVWTVPATMTMSDIIITAMGYETLAASLDIASTHDKVHNKFALTPVFPPAPAPFTVTHSTTSFNSLYIDIPSYGKLPWFDATLSSFTPAQRQVIYAAKKANGDTAAIVDVSWNYAEPGQPYGAGNLIPPTDLTHDLIQFRSLVQEVIQNGFIPWVFLAGDGESRSDCSYNDPIGWTYGYQCLVDHILPDVMAILKQPPDLTPYVLFVPGFDGVFYGWEPSQVKVPNFAFQVHQLCPTCLAGVEFNTGHIPVGNGPSDYQPGGLMSGYAVLLGEFDPWPTRNDATWQVVARLSPVYHRPPDQPADDDPHPPYYLSQSPIVFHCFEWGTYAHVRSQSVDGGWNYYTNLGCPIVEK